LEDVGNLGRARVARQGEPSGGEVELGGADGRDAEHGQVGPRPVVVVAAVGLGGLLGAEVHRHHLSGGRAVHHGG
jgi:hypothetical protein